MTFKTLLAAAVLLPAAALAQSAQPLPCLADDLSLAAPHYIPTAEDLARMAQDEAQLEAFTQLFAEAEMDGARNTYIISVVFHIIHDNGPENISDEQVYDAMRVLNDDFNKLNSDWSNVKPEFLGLVADVGIEFRLAKKDPNGNCTKGITRTQSALTHQGDQTMKNLIQWPRSRYLNVWVAASANGAAGYTYRPAAVNNAPALDGIVLLHSYTGSIGTSSPYKSRTLTHEVGHWINLMHTWGNSNNPGLASNCSDDDQVSDTPNTMGWTSCNLNGVTCSTLDNVENYMDYSYCSKMFTTGQKTRMIAALNSGTAQRSTLWQPNTLQLTGVLLPDALCAAEFSHGSNTFCAGGSITFQDLSFHAVTSRTWEFPGGTPATSTSANPTVTYAEPGTYQVTLTVSDGVNTMSTTMQQAVTVLPSPGVPVPHEDGFEAYAALNDSPWVVANPDNDNTWTLNNAAAFTGDKSVRILNTAAMNGRKDELLSQPVDMSGADEVRISYRYAFAQRTSGSDDRLRVWVSNNCGATWSMRQQLRGTISLNTAGAPMQTSFVPNGPGQWGYTEVTNVSAAYHVADFRFKFEFESYGGNNIYLDDINVNGMPVGMGELLLGDGALMVVPNPAEDMATVVYDLQSPGMTRLEVLDMLGRVTHVLRDGQHATGPHRVEIPVNTLNAGVYLVRLVQGDRQEVVRFVKQ
ncbi:MAG: T9SS type A sorting domain-containing protein [Flavobacteriales bacterium]|nr:T9SS type A sorting domain-containing protein [Flavobacteriales bacterium]